MKQASCNMSNTETYIRTSGALIVAFIAIKYELWPLIIISGILFYTAYNKFCLFYSILGINKKYSIENYYYALLPENAPYFNCIFNNDGDTIYQNKASKKEFNIIHKASEFGISDVDIYIQTNGVLDTLLEREGQTYQLHLRGLQKEKVLLLYINNITEVLDLEYINTNLERKVKNVLTENELKNHLLAQQSKFVTTGELIENIVHQWKQPLSALNSLLLNIHVQNTLTGLSVEKLNEEVDRATKLIQIMNSTIDDFRNFYKADKEKVEFSIESCMKDVILILESSLKRENIKVVNTIDSDIYISGFKNEFTQVLLNIINNSKDAFVQNNIENREINIATHIENYKVVLQIYDTAGGISEENIEKIFEPHFTTKEELEGTGIGLHISKIIIENDMDGTINVENFRGGARFKLVFPLSASIKKPLIIDK